MDYLSAAISAPSFLDSILKLWGRRKYGKYVRIINTTGHKVLLDMRYLMWDEDRGHWIWSPSEMIKNKKGEYIQPDNVTGIMRLALEAGKSGYIETFPSKKVRALVRHIVIHPNYKLSDGSLKKLPTINKEIVSGDGYESSQVLTYEIIIQIE